MPEREKEILQGTKCPHPERPDSLVQPQAMEPVVVFPGISESAMARPNAIIKKTPGMKRLEEVVGDVAVFLEDRYLERGDGSTYIAREIAKLTGGKAKPSPSGVINWLGKCGITRRPKEEAVRLVHKNPDKSRDISAKIHSDEANKKKAKGITRAWAMKSAEERVAATQRMRDAVKLSRLSHYGGNPVSVVEDLHNRGFTTEEIALKLGRSVNWIKILKKNAEVSTGRKRSGKSDEKDRATYFDAIEDGALEGLSKSARTILANYFLIKQRPTLEEMAGALGITREGVRQIKKRALQKLRKGLGKDRLESRRKDQASVVSERPPLPPYIINLTGKPWATELMRLPLSARTYNSLSRAGNTYGSRYANLRYLYDMPDYELLKLRGFGKRCLQELREQLELFRQSLLRNQPQE